MISRHIVLLMFIFCLSCNTQTVSKRENEIISTGKESNEIANAKWYYYSYVMELKAYDRASVEIQPLACDIRVLRLLKVGADTTKVFFNAFNKDTLNVCSFRPYDLVGITIVRNKLYLPIYHSIVFDKENDSIVLEKMNKQSLLLQSKALGNNEIINPWLKTEAKRRKAL